MEGERFVAFGLRQFMNGVANLWAGQFGSDRA
jgi:hypothetical protein